MNEHKWSYNNSISLCINCGLIRMQISPYEKTWYLFNGERLIQNNELNCNELIIKSIIE